MESIKISSRIPDSGHGGSTADKKKTRLLSLFAKSLLLVESKLLKSLF